MKYYDSMKTFSIVLLVSTLIFSAAGCVNLDRKYPDVRTYSLDASEQAHGDYSGTPVSLRMNAFTATPQAVDRYFLYRSGETTYDSDFYNQFISAPSEMIRNQASAWLKSSPLVKFVLMPGETTDHSYGVDGLLTDLYGDYRDPNSPKAVLVLKMTVSDDGAEPSNVVMQKVYSQEVPMNRISPKTLAEGWNKALCQILEDFENDLKVLISNKQ